MTDVQPNTTTPQPQDSTRPGVAPTRRAVLVGSGALGATCLLAACGTEANTPAAPLPAGSANAPAGGAKTGGNALAAVRDVPSGGGVIRGDYVITQPSEGTFRAFSKVCTHQGCDVSEIKDGGIVCRCHNSIFSIEDGSVKSGPAKAPLKATEVKPDGDNIVIV
jgi:Rieske Fe-S protein